MVLVMLMKKMVDISLPLHPTLTQPCVGGTHVLGTPKVLQGDELGGFLHHRLDCSGFLSASPLGFFIYQHDRCSTVSQGVKV